jgi:hypothetical protein
MIWPLAEIPDVIDHATKPFGNDCFIDRDVGTQ